MSGGLLGIPGIFANRRCMNSAKGESFKIVSSPHSSISSPTCWTRSQLFLKLRFLQTLWLFHSREFGINSIQMTALRRLMTEEFMASHLLPICYKRKGEMERARNSSYSPPDSQSHWERGADRPQPGSPWGLRVYTLSRAAAAPSEPSPPTASLQAGCKARREALRHW